MVFYDIFILLPVDVGSVNSKLSEFEVDKCMLGTTEEKNIGETFSENLRKAYVVELLNFNGYEIELLATPCLLEKYPKFLPYTRP